MREIKFRAWDTEDINQMIYQENEKEYNKETYVIDFFEKIQGHNNILMQFTGLKDKNGKEIYEGDVVIWFADNINKKAIIKWEWNGYVANRIGEDVNGFNRKYNFQSFIPVTLDEFDGEVIGNIYENPELTACNAEEAS